MSKHTKSSKTPAKTTRAPLAPPPISHTPDTVVDVEELDLIDEPEPVGSGKGLMQLDPRLPDERTLNELAERRTPFVDSVADVSEFATGIDDELAHDGAPDGRSGFTMLDALVDRFEADQAAREERKDAMAAQYETQEFNTEEHPREGVFGTGIDGVRNYMVTEPTKLAAMPEAEQEHERVNAAENIRMLQSEVDELRATLNRFKLDAPEHVARLEDLHAQSLVQWDAQRDERDRQLSHVLGLLSDRANSEHRAYAERNKLVAVLARVYPSGIRPTAIEGWDPEWNGCVYLDTPTGQLSWHYHTNEAPLFEGLQPYTKPWDEHTTEQKYERIEQLVELLDFSLPHVVQPEPLTPAPRRETRAERRARQAQHSPACIAFQGDCICHVGDE